MKYDGIDWLRGIAAFGIVGCHLALAPMSDACWRIRDLCDMNVGLFAALSGFLMFKNGGIANLREYMKKRCLRLLPVYFIWTLVFIAFGLIFDATVRHGLNTKWQDLWFYPKVVFGGQASAHLWFLICLFYVQIVVAMFSKVLQLLGGWILLVLGFVVVFAASLYMNVWFWGYPIRMLGFVLTGYALRVMIAQGNIFLTQRFILWIFLGMAVAVAHYFISKDCVSAFVKDWFLAVPLLLSFVTMPKVAGAKARIGSLLSETSMGVYLVHPIITAGIGLAMRRMFSSPYGVLPFVLDMLISYIIALGIAYILVRIKSIRKYVM